MHPLLAYLRSTICLHDLVTLHALPSCTCNKFQTIPSCSPLHIAALSGVRDRIGEAIQPEEIYDLFLKKLEDVLPKTTLDKAIYDSFVTKKSVMKRGNSELSGFFNGSNQLDSIAMKKKQKTSTTCDENVKIKCADEFSFQFSFDK
jgi:hypothetical protein